MKTFISALTDSYKLFRVTNKPGEHSFGLWEEVEAPEIKKKPTHAQRIFKLQAGKHLSGLGINSGTLLMWRSTTIKWLTEYITSKIFDVLTNWKFLFLISEIKWLMKMYLQRKSEQRKLQFCKQWFFFLKKGKVPLLSYLHIQKRVFALQNVSVFFFSVGH